LGKWHEFEFTDGKPAFCMQTSKQTGLTPIYRIYNTRTGVHLYTRGEADRDKVLRTWPEFEFTDGAPAFWASLTKQDDMTPIYRLYNTKTGVHLYTRGEADRDKVLRTWPEFEFTDGAPAFWAKI
jgi:glucose dehydrogenase